MNPCPTCGRRHRARRVKPLAPLAWDTSPLGAWRSPRPPAEVPGPLRRLVVLHGCLNPDGEPRAGITQPDGPTLAFHDLAAAAAALRQMEARR